MSRWAAEEADCRIAIWADTNTRELSKVPPERQTLRRAATRELMQTMMQRSSDGRAPLGRDDVPDQRPRRRRRDEPRATSRTSTTAPAWPTTPTRSGAWKRASEECHRLAEWIEGREEVRIVAEGTDLRLGIAGRHFIPCDGEHNMPDGEFFTGPIEDSVEGEVSFHLPATIGGREVAGVRLRFEAGKVVDASAERGEEYLISMLDTDEGAGAWASSGSGPTSASSAARARSCSTRRSAGPSTSRSGASYPESGGTNESAVHTDLVCDLRRGGRLEVDGEVLQQDGAFAV